MSLSLRVLSLGCRWLHLIKQVSWWWYSLPNIVCLSASLDGLCSDGYNFGSSMTNSCCCLTTYISLLEVTLSLLDALFICSIVCLVCILLCAKTTANAALATVFVSHLTCSTPLCVSCNKYMVLLSGLLCVVWSIAIRTLLPTYECYSAPW